MDWINITLPGEKQKIVKKGQDSLKLFSAAMPYRLTEEASPGKAFDIGRLIILLDVEKFRVTILKICTDSEMFL